jgi:hypothetical protein
MGSHARCARPHAIEDERLDPAEEPSGPYGPHSVRHPNAATGAQQRVEFGREDSRPRGWLLV